MIISTSPTDPFIFSTPELSMPCARTGELAALVASEQRKELRKPFENLMEENWLANGFLVLKLVRVLPCLEVRRMFWRFGGL